MGNLRIIRRAREVWEHKPTVNSVFGGPTAPTLNVYDTAFEDVSGWKRLVGLTITRTNIEADARDVRVRWTLDGNVFTSIPAVTLNHGDLYYCFRAPMPDTVSIRLTTTPRNMVMYTNIMCESAKIEVMPVTSMGTGVVHSIRLIYEELRIV